MSLLQTRRETSIMETPLAISAVTQEELTRYGITNIKDLSYSLPGLAIQNSDTNAPIINCINNKKRKKFIGKNLI